MTNYKTLVMPIDNEPKPIGLEWLFYRRMLPRYEARWRFVYDQLAARDRTTRDAWGDCEIRLHVLDVAARAIQKEFLWPNLFYLPDDPLCALFVRIDWQREFVFAFFDIRKHLHLPRKGSDVPIPLKTATFGEFVDSVVTVYRGLPQS